MRLGVFGQLFDPVFIRHPDFLGHLYMEQLGYQRLGLKQTTGLRERVGLRPILEAISGGTATMLCRAGT